MSDQRIRLHPGESVRIDFIEPLVNGYPNDLATIDVTWQDRDAPAGEIASKHREIQVDVTRDKRAGPLVVMQP